MAITMVYGKGQVGRWVRGGAAPGNISGSQRGCVGPRMAWTATQGFLPGWIQITGTVGLFLSLIVIFLSLIVIAITRGSMTAESFASWGWRIPFVGSILLLAVSLYIRPKLHESPVFNQMKAEGRGSPNPIKEIFGEGQNVRLLLLAIFGIVAGQAVVWYTGHFYSLYFMTTTLRMSADKAHLYLLTALALGTPFFVVFGWLSDRIGRKWIVVTGCTLSALLFIPLFQGLSTYGNPALAEFRASTTVVLEAAECGGSGIRFFGAPSGDCAAAKEFLTVNAVPYTVETGAAEFGIQFGDETHRRFDESVLHAALIDRGLPPAGAAAEPNGPMVKAMLFTLVFLATMVYGPLGALLVELFPARIRYSGVSVAMQIGNGWIGGFAPFIATAIVVATGRIFGGLWYTVVVAAVTALVGALLLPETRGRSITG